MFKDLEIGRYYWILSLYLLMKEWIGSANGYVILEYTYKDRHCTRGGSQEKLMSNYD